MKSTYHKLIALLGLAGSLTLPGLAMADNNGRYSPKYPAHQAQEQRHERHGNHQDRDRHQQHERHRHDDRRHYGSYNHGRHQGHGHGHHYAYRVGHYHGHRYCALDHGPAYYYGGGYPAAYVSGVYVTPSLGLHIDLR